MNRYKMILSLAVGCLGLGFTAIAQQPPTAKQRSPVLTSEDLARSRGQSGSTVVLSAVEPKEWFKFTPGGLRLSLELPGELDPTEAPMPDYVLNELHRDYGDAKSYVGNTNSLSVDMLYLPSNKPSVSPAELKSTAGRFMKVISLALDRMATYSAEPSGKSKVSVKANFTMADEPYELLGTMQSRGREIWLVTSVFRQSDETARKIALRIVGSATLY
jgi:hypothetical protein